MPDGLEARRPKAVADKRAEAVGETAFPDWPDIPKRMGCQRVRNP
jgi:hypothetical protein